ncbi:MAG: efflux RND transporter periplasmic adaptor subunit [Burkholderiaceae bacterium]
MRSDSIMAAAPLRLASRPVSVCVLSLALAFWLAAQAVAQTSLPPVPPVPVVVPGAPQAARVADGPNTIRVLLSAELETTLAAQMAGQIESLQVGLGDAIKAGQVLARFDCAESDARLKMAEAEAAAARETLGVKQRLRKLDAAGETEVTLARIALRKSASAIEVAKAQLAYCDVKAPFDGHVVRVHVKPYQSVSPGAPLLELVSAGALKLRMNVPSQLLRKVKIGSPMTVDILETGNSYAAEVSAINARVDAVAQTIELEAKLKDAPAELLPGMSGVARFAE